MHPAGPDLTSFVLLDPLSTFSATAQKQATFHSNQTLPLVMWEHTKMYLPHCNHCIHVWGSTIWVSWACCPILHRNQSLAVTDISWLRSHLLYSLWTITCSLFKSRLLRPLSNSSFHIISGFASRSNILHFRIHCHPYRTSQPIMLWYSDLVSFVCLMCLVCKASIQNQQNDTETNI